MTNNILSHSLSLLDNFKFQECIDFLKEIPDEDKNASIYVVEARSYSSLSIVPMALTSIELAIKLNPLSVKYLNIAYSIAIYHGYFNDAINYVHKILKLIDGADSKWLSALYRSNIGLKQFDIATNLLIGIDLKSNKSILYNRNINEIKVRYSDLYSVWIDSLSPYPNDYNYSSSSIDLNFTSVEVIQYWSQNEIPENVKRITEFWNLNIFNKINLSIKVFNKTEAFQWINENAPEFSVVFADAFHFAVEADIFRLAFASKRACIYLDVDAYPLRNTLNIIIYCLKNKFSLLQFRFYQPLLCNGFFISFPDSAFINKICADVRDIDLSSMPKSVETVEATFGPRRFNETIYSLISTGIYNKSSNSNFFCLSKDSKPEIYFSNDVQVAAVKPPFILEYKNTSDNWKFLS